MIILGGVLGVVTIFLNMVGSKKTLKIIFGILSILIIITATILGVYNHLSIEKTEKYSRSTGDYEMEDIPKNFRINVGSNIFDGYNNVSLENYVHTPVTIFVDEGKLKVSTLIFDKDGNILVRVNEGKGKIYSDYGDLSFDNNALEVLNNNEVIFQVFYSNNIINVFGDFYNEEGNHIVVDSSGVYINSEIKPIINKLFKYPSEEYLGK